MPGGVAHPRQAYQRLSRRRRNTVQLAGDTSHATNVFGPKRKAAWQCKGKVYPKLRDGALNDPFGAVTNGAFESRHNFP
jgi:hypothetical protein